MKSRKRGELQTAVAASADKHKLWLIIGIVLVVVLVLAVVFLSPAKEALFGKALLGTQPIPTGIISPTGTRVTPIGVGGFEVATCYDVNTFPLRQAAYTGTGELTGTRPSNQDKFVTSVSRMDFCETILNCAFQGYENADTANIFYNEDNTYDTSDDLCIGTAQRCLPVQFRTGGGLPNVDGVEVDFLFWRSGTVWNTARKNACESIRTVAGTGCYFHDRGGINVINPIAVNIESNAEEVFEHHSQDACLPFGAEGASCSVSGTSGVWVYSFLPGEIESIPLLESTETIPAFPPMTRENDDASRRTACCADANSCANVQHQCIGRDTEYTYGRNDARDFICGDDNNWDRCGPLGDERYNKYPDDPSDGGNYVCQLVGEVYQWEQVVEPEIEICDDGIDNDGNELIDCADSSCFGQVGFTPENPGVSDPVSGVLCMNDECFCTEDENSDDLCADGFDNDADGAADCSDISCAAEESCVEENPAVAPAVVRGNVYTDYNYDVDPPALLDPQLLDTNDLLMLSLLIEANANDLGNAGSRPYRGDFYGYPVWICDSGHYSFTELASCPHGRGFSNEANVYTDYNYDVDPPALLDPQLLDTNDLLMLSLLIEANANDLGNAGTAPYQGDFYGYPVWVCDDGDYSFTGGEIISC